MQKIYYVTSIEAKKDHIDSLLEKKDKLINRFKAFVLKEVIRFSGTLHGLDKEAKEILENKTANLEALTTNDHKLTARSDEKSSKTILPKQKTSNKMLNDIQDSIIKPSINLKNSKAASAINLADQNPNLDNGTTEESKKNKDNVTPANPESPPKAPATPYKNKGRTNPSPSK